MHCLGVVSPGEEDIHPQVLPHKLVQTLADVNVLLHAPHHHLAEHRMGDWQDNMSWCCHFSQRFEG